MTSPGAKLAGNQRVGTRNLWYRIIIIIITSEIVLIFKADIEVIEVDDRPERIAVTVDIVGQILWPLTVKTCSAEVQDVESIGKCLC